MVVMCYIKRIERELQYSQINKKWMPIIKNCSIFNNFYYFTYCDVYIDTLNPIFKNT